MAINKVTKLTKEMLGEQDGYGKTNSMVVFGSHIDGRGTFYPGETSLRPPDYVGHSQSDFLQLYKDSVGDTRKYSHENAFEVAVAVGQYDDYSPDAGMTVLPEHKTQILDQAKSDFGAICKEFLKRSSDSVEPVQLYLPVDENGHSALGADYGGLPGEMKNVMDAEMALTEEFCRLVDERHQANGFARTEGELDLDAMYDEIMAEAKANLQGASVPEYDLSPEEQEQDLAVEEERKKRQQGSSDDFPDRSSGQQVGTGGKSSSQPEKKPTHEKKDSVQPPSALWGSYLKEMEGKKGYKKAERGEGEDRVVEHRFVPEKDQQALVAEGNGHYTQVTGPDGVALSARANGSVDIAVGDDGSKLNVLCSSPAEIASGQPSVKIDATEISDQSPGHFVSVGPEDKKVTLQFSAGGEVSLYGDKKHQDVAEDIEFTVNGPEGATFSAGFRFDEQGQESLYNRDTGEALSFDKEQGGYALATTGPEQDGQGQEQEAPGQERDAEGQGLGDDGFQEDIPSEELPQREWDQLSEEERQAARSTGADKLNLGNSYEDAASLDQGLGGALEEPEQEDQFANINLAQLGKGMAGMELADGETVSAPDGAMSAEHLAAKREQETSL